MCRRLATQISGLAALALFVAACSVPAGRPGSAAAAAAQRLQPGDTLSGMALTTGSSAVVSIWTVCHPETIPNEQSTTDCSVPAAPLGIGPNLSALPSGPSAAEWGLLEWTLSLDGQPLDLEAFGTFDLVQPHKAQHGAEAFFVYRGWDVVLAQPTPGQHALQVAVTRRSHPGKEVGMLIETTGWLINLTVKP
jgi:hypothetical protein